VRKIPRGVFVEKIAGVVVMADTAKKLGDSTLDGLDQPNRQTKLRVRRGSRMVVLFADVVGSTRLYETLGDKRAREIVRGVLWLVMHEVQKQSGVVIKEVGDETMAAFTDPEMAVVAASEMQAILDAQDPQADMNIKMQLRIGLHMGPVIADRNDLFGDAVNIAARIAGKAKPSQIITSAETVGALPELCRRNTRFYGTTTLRGKSEPIDLHEVLWEVGGTTTQLVRSPTATAIQKPVPIHLTLRYGDDGFNFLFRPGKPRTITIGRSESNDMVIRHQSVSRHHGEITCRGGRWLVYTDRSINGTYVRVGTLPCMKVCQDEHILDCEGNLFLGGSPRQDDPDRDATRVYWKSIPIPPEQDREL